MITYKCHNCGGEMSISPSGDLCCAYCGTKGNFSDAQLRGYREFRNQLLQYLAAAADRKTDEEAAERLWEYAESAHYRTEDDQPVTVEYLFQTTDDGVQMYLARENVIYVFGPERAKDAGRMLGALSRVRIPKADMKGLTRYFPVLKTRLPLEGGGVLLAFSREENMYPLGAFGSLDYASAAWILSRLENLCCVMEYSQLVHGGLTLESLLINPYTHEAALYGGWWKTRGKIGGDVTDLRAAREVCRRLLGVRPQAPEAFLEFLKSAPAGDAYRDFEVWDEVIERKMGGRHFKKFDMDTMKKGM